MFYKYLIKGQEKVQLGDENGINVFFLESSYAIECRYKVFQENGSLSHLPKVGWIDSVH